MSGAGSLEADSARTELTILQSCHDSQKSGIDNISVVGHADDIDKENSGCFARFDSQTAKWHDAGTEPRPFSQSQTVLLRALIRTKGLCF